MNTSIDTGSPLYEALAERLRKSINQGAYRPGDLIGSEHGLAREQSISRMTVRRASELLINEGLVERRPGKGLYVRNGDSGDGRARVIQVIVGNLHWEPSVQISRGVQSWARRQRMQVQLYDAHGDVGLDLEMLDHLPDTPAEGAVIVALHSKAFNETIFDLKRRRFPFVLVDQKFNDIDLPSVTADNHAGGALAGRHLLDHGHERIGFVGDLIATTVRDRLAGLRDAIADAGRPFDRSLVIDLCKDHDHDRLEDWSANIETCTRQLMQRDDPPTAVFFSCDAVARAGCRAMQAMGLRVPGDVSVIGFDDDPLCQWMSPALTTVRQPFYAMGEAAIEMLGDLMAHPGAQVAARVLPVELVERESVSRAPAAG